MRIEYHENQRGQYTNVYLDKVEPAEDEPGGGDGGTDADEAAWRTAVEAAPWLVGESEPQEAVPPDELYEKLKPFKEQVAEDIRESEATRASAASGRARSSCRASAAAPPVGREAQLHAELHAAARRAGACAPCRWRSPAASRCRARFTLFETRFTPRAAQ